MPEGGTQTTVEYEIRLWDTPSISREYLPDLRSVSSRLKELSSDKVIGVYRVYKSPDSAVVKSERLNWKLSGGNLLLTTEPTEKPLRLIPESLTKKREPKPLSDLDSKKDVSPPQKDTLREAKSSLAVDARKPPPRPKVATPRPSKPIGEARKPLPRPKVATPRAPKPKSEEAAVLRGQKPKQEPREKSMQKTVPEARRRIPAPRSGVRKIKRG